MPAAQVLEALYLQCCLWSVGAAVVQTPEAPDRDRLDAFLKQCAGLKLASGDAVPLGMLPQQSLYSFFVDEDAIAWKVRAWTSAPVFGCTEAEQLEPNIAEPVLCPLRQQVHGCCMLVTLVKLVCSCCCVGHAYVHT